MEYTFKHPSLTRYAAAVYDRLKSDIDSGALDQSGLSDMLIENVALQRKGEITPVFGAINKRVLETLQTTASSISALSALPRMYRNRRISGLGNLWDTVKDAAESIYSAGESALETVGDFIEITSSDTSVDINIPDVESWLESLKETGLVSITAAIPESIYGIPTWLLGAGALAAVVLLLRRK